MNFSRKTRFLFLLCLLLSCVPISAPADSKNDKASSFVVRVTDHLLTVKVKDIPVKRVLMEIAHQAQIKILFYGPGEELLTAEFSDIPLDKGLKRLTAHSNYAFIYEPKKATMGEPAIREIIIYPKASGGRAKGGVPAIISPKKLTPEEQKEATLVSLFKALEDKDPAVREDTVYLLSEFNDERIIKHLTEALLTDEEKAVRASAAEELGDLGDQRAIEALIKALQDKEALVRQSAVEALGQIGGKRVISHLMEALEDEDEDVSAAAAEALGEIK